MRRVLTRTCAFRASPRVAPPPAASPHRLQLWLSVFGSDTLRRRVSRSPATPDQRLCQPLQPLGAPASAPSPPPAPPPALARSASPLAPAPAPSPPRLLSSPCSTQSAPLLGAGALAPTPPAPAPRLLQPRLRLTRPRRSLLTLRPRLLRRPPPCLATLPRGRWPPCLARAPGVRLQPSPCRCARAAAPVRRVLTRAYAFRASPPRPAPPLQEPQPHHPKIAIWDPPKSKSYLPTS